MFYDTREKSLTSVMVVNVLFCLVFYLTHVMCYCMLITENIHWSYMQHFRILFNWISFSTDNPYVIQHHGEFWAHQSNLNIQVQLYVLLYLFVIELSSFLFPVFGLASRLFRGKQLGSRATISRGEESYLNEHTCVRLYVIVSVQDFLCMCVGVGSFCS